MSHKDGFYVKKLSKRDALGTKKLTDLFSKKPRTDTNDNQAGSGLSNEVESSDLDEERASASCSTSCTYTSSDMRLFSSEKYESKYQWLYFSFPKRGYMCKLCEYFGRNSVFTTGTGLGDHPTRLLESHENSKAHTDAEEMRLASRSTTVNVHRLLNEQPLSKKDTNREVVKKLLQCANFLIRRRWALSDNFELFVKFVAQLGVEELMNHIQTAPANARYLSSFSVLDILDTMSMYLESDILESLRGEKFFTLLADESTDESGREQFALFGKWSFHGDISEHFLGIVHINKTDSLTLTDAIQRFFLAKGVSLENLRFVAFDGTNSMSGCNTGVQRRLRNVSPLSVYMNCRAHKLALVMVHLMKIKEYDILQQVDSCLLGLWKLFEYSPRKFEIFRSVQAAYGKQPLHLIKAATTRWLSHGLACERVVDRYSELVDCLDALYDDRKEPEVFGLCSVLLKKKVTSMIFLLSDVLRILNELSLFLQRADMNFNDIPHQVKNIVDHLDNLMVLYEERASHQNLKFSKIDDAYLIILERTSLQQRRREGAHAQTAATYSPEDFLRETGFPFIRSLRSELEDQFVCSPVLKAFGVLDPRNMPENICDLSNYGKTGIETLANMYGTSKSDTFKGHTKVVPADFDSPQAVMGEFEAFKSHMFVERQNMQRRDDEISTTSLYRVMKKDKILSELYPRMIQLLGIAVLIPCSTASVERGFSLMNSLCTNSRNRLGQGSLDALMRICSEGKEEFSKYDLEKMVDIFKNKKERRLDL
ncbi:uncharacterized protein LOC117343277 [Pecten maximus]|uniref:uncharacterized protein LOC117343277 n=1 Tax=Pecten maximus TaxID=6579 RepID=UPI001458668D|nr:uncharacterized protein LOC117343277 [Pecten maximus]